MVMSGMLEGWSSVTWGILATMVEIDVYVDSCI
uniref:Uncharacterized protein n=1 Tax=Arundo donax TaxID=35708 RepID=A0A0A9CKL2_ARUDO